MNDFALLVLIVTVIIIGYQHKVYLYIEEVENTINDMEDELERYRNALIKLSNDVYDDEDDK